MPMYRYTSDDGMTSCDRMFPMGQAPAEIHQGGLRLLRDYTALPNVAPPSCWPRVSEALGVHPDQAGELATLMQKDGIPGEVVMDGEMAGAVKLGSKAEERKHSEMRGYYQRNAGPGDAVPKRARNLETI